MSSKEKRRRFILFFGRAASLKSFYLLSYDKNYVQGVFDDEFYQGYITEY